MNTESSDKFIDRLYSNGIEVAVYMKSGIRIGGIIINNDDVSIQLERTLYSNSMIMLIYKSSISTILSLEDDKKAKSIRNDQHGNH